MAFELVFDGVNDNLTITTPVSVGTADFSMRFVFRYNGNVSQVLFGNSSNTNDLFRITNSTTVLLKLNTTSTNVTLASALTVGDHTWRVTRSGNTLDITDDLGTSLLSSTISNTNTFTIHGFGFINAGGNRFGGGLQLAQYYSDAAATTLVNSWDATASSHGSGGTTLTDTVSGNDMIGANFPTDGSQWVDLSGGGVTVTALLNSNYMVEYNMKKNVSGQSIGAQMVTISDGSDFAGSVTTNVTIDNGTQTTGNGTVTYEGGGYHSYAPTKAETDGDHIAVSFSGSGALTQTIQTYTTFPQTTDNDTKISLIPTTAMRGTDNSLLSSGYVAPDNSSIASILADTNELQSNQSNWLTATGFSTFDYTADQVVVSNMRGTDGANTVAPDNAGISNILADTNELQVNQGNWLTATGFSTLVATDIVTGGAITTNSGNANINVVKINGATVLGAGTSGNLWRS